MRASRGSTLASQIDGIVQLQQRVGVVGDRDVIVVERDAHQCAITTLGISRPRTVDEHVAHGQGRREQ